MTLIKLFIRSYGTYLKSLFEYRPAFVTDLLANILTYSLFLVGIWVLMDKFKMIQGWSLYEVLLIFNMNMVSYALCSFFFRTPFYNDIEEMLRTGKFDIVLIRPMNPLLYMLLGRPTIAYLGHMTLGTIVFFICFNNLDVDWSWIKAVFLGTTIIGGAVVQAAIYLAVSSLGFWIVRTLFVYDTVMGDVRSFVEYPINIYIRFMQVILTFILPFAFVNFYPAHYILGKNTGDLFHPILQYGTPFVGVFLFVLAYQFWKTGVNHYESTGS